MRTVIVTGAAGFLGSHLSEYFLEKDYSVLGIDNLISSSGKNAEMLKKKYPSFRFQKRDVCAPWEDLQVEEDLEYVFHFASPASPRSYGQYPFETIAANTQGLMNALHFARDRKARVIFASSSEVYGDPLVNPQVEEYWGNANPHGHRSCYHEAKRLAESIIFEFNRVHEARHGMVRIFNTYGPRMSPEDGRVVINFLVQALAGQKLTIHGDGRQTRSFCYVDDLINGIAKYAASGLNQPINLGNSEEVSVFQVAGLVQNLHPQKQLQYEYKKLPQDDPRVRRPDITKAQEQLQWSPQIDLRTGLQRTAEWLERSL